MRAFVTLALLVITLPAKAAIVSETFVDRGRPLKLNQKVLLGEVQEVDGCLVVRSAKPGTNDNFGGHYISIGMLADALLAPGD